MIQYLKHNEIDKKKWNDCIDHSVNNLIYSYSWYLDIVCPNWNALLEDDYTSIMPLTAGKKYGIDCPVNEALIDIIKGLEVK